MTDDVPDSDGSGPSGDRRPAAGGSGDDDRVELPDPFTGGGPSLPGGRYLVGVLVVLALLALVVGWFFRPWFHSLLYGLVYGSPGVLQWLVVTVILAGIGWRLVADRPLVARAVLALAVLTLALAALAPIVGSEYANEHLAGEVEADLTSLDELPETATDTPRILPAAVAEQYAQNSLQFPQHSIGVGDITFLDGVPHWSYPLRPDGLVNTFIGKQAGAVFVDMTTQESRVNVTEQEFQCGEGQQLTDNYRWKLLKNKYTVQYQDPFMVRQDGDLHMAVPYVNHAHQFRLSPLPQVYSIPRFAGVALIDADCSISQLSPADARQHPALEGQRLYPYDLARLRVNSMQYQNGILNKWFTHEDQLEIAPVPGRNNDQPFTVTTADGVTFIVAAEPWGDAAGIYQIWTIDARTGQMARFKTTIQNAMLGPRKAANYVEQDNPRVNWGSMSPSEPLPVVRNGTLYWEVRVVPDSGAGVTYTAFVNANTGNVIRYEDDESVRAFIAGRGQVPGDGDDGGDGPPGDGGDGLVIVIVDENGNVLRTIPVGENESIRVERGANATVQAPG